MTKTDDAGLGDGGRLWKADRRGRTTKGVATSYIMMVPRRRQSTRRRGGIDIIKRLSADDVISLNVIAKTHLIKFQDNFDNFSARD